ncbi:MAG TPA: hypothetical protein VLJ44_09320 [Gaiellaceae bacterium]|nr:hypothetical protein [Gaiellaceae bacterium]
MTTNPTTALSLTWGVHVPAGLKVIGGAWHGHPLGTACTSDCRFDIPEGTISQPYDYELVAARPGTYTLIAQLATTSTSDPDPSNNSASMQIDVVPLKLHLSSVAAAKPRAGKRFTWTVATSSAISRQGVRPDRATCSARVGAKAIAGKATITSGRVVCAWLLPAGSRGSRLVTTAHTTLAGATASLTRTFTIGR